MPEAAFAAAINTLFADPNIATGAIYRAGGGEAPGTILKLILDRCGIWVRYTLLMLLERGSGAVDFVVPKFVKGLILFR